MLTDGIHPETKMASYQDAVAAHKDWPVSVTLVPSFAASASNASWSYVRINLVMCGFVSFCKVFVISVLSTRVNSHLFIVKHC